MTTTAHWSIGLVGFSYPEWSATLYANMPSRKHSAADRLARYSSFFNAAEINTTFYGIPSADAVRTWADATPSDFRFCVKMPRAVTHGPTPPGLLASAAGPPPGHLLLDETLAIAHRLREAIQPLGDKLGAVLLQFPPKFSVARRDELAQFLEQLKLEVPLAIELRHDDWWNPETDAILREHGVCLVAADESHRRQTEASPNPDESSKGAPRPIMPTTDFLYVRWLGKHDQFTDRSKEHFDPSPRLHWWAKRLQAVLSRHPGIRSIYGFFDNDFAGHAPATALRFMNILGLPTHELPKPGTDQPTLFQ